MYSFPFFLSSKLPTNKEVFYFLVGAKKEVRFQIRVTM